METAATPTKTRTGRLRVQKPALCTNVILHKTVPVPPPRGVQRKPAGHRRRFPILRKFECVAGDEIAAQEYAASHGPTEPTSMCKTHVVRLKVGYLPASQLPKREPGCRATSH